MTAPAVVRQGKAVVEPDADEFLVMLPDGEVRGASTARKAEHIARAWFKRHAAKTGCVISLGEIEWRHGSRPDGGAS